VREAINVLQSSCRICAYSPGSSSFYSRLRLLAKRVLLPLELASPVADANQHPNQMRSLRHGHNLELPQALS
jgi:hypothetical protein